MTEEERRELRGLVKWDWDRRQGSREDLAALSARVNLWCVVGCVRLRRCCRFARFAAYARELPHGCAQKAFGRHAGQGVRRQRRDGGRKVALGTADMVQRGAAHKLCEQV